MNKPLKYLVLHCSATTVEQNTTYEDIVKMHTLPVSKGGRGWSKVGYGVFIEASRTAYSYIDDRDGIVDGFEITNGVKGINGEAKHICYAGGVIKERGQLIPKDTRNEFQRNAMKDEIYKVLGYKYDVLIAGHNQFNNKACPSFWVPDYLEEIGVPDKNIYRADPFGYAKYYGSKSPKWVNQTLKNGIVSVTSHLRIRNKPWGDYVGVLNNGTKINIYEIKNGWYKINPHKDEWVHGDYIK